MCLILGFAARPTRKRKNIPVLLLQPREDEQRSTAIIDFRVAQIGAYDSCVATVGSTFAAEDSAASRYPIWEYASARKLPEALEFE